MVPQYLERRPQAAVRRTEAAAPPPHRRSPGTAVLAVGLGTIFRRKSTLLENVIIQSVGAASGLVVAGAIFTLPALFITSLSEA